MTDTKKKEFQNALFKKSQEMNIKAIESGLYTPDVLYLDIALCKDFKLGYALAKLMMSDKSHTEKEQIYNQITAQIPAYQDRLYDVFAEYFPFLGYTDDEIDQALRDPQNAALIFKYAPNTEFYNTINADLFVNINHSQVKEKYKKIGINEKTFYRSYDEITFILNTFPLQLPALEHSVLATFFTKTYGVNVQIISVDPMLFSMQHLWLKSVDQFYVFDISTWMENPYIRNKMDETVQYFDRPTSTIMSMPDPAKNPALFAHKRFYARKIFSRISQQKMVGKDFEYQFGIATTQMSLYTTFEWIPFEYCRLVPQTEEGSPS